MSTSSKVFGKTKLASKSEQPFGDAAMRKQAERVEEYQAMKSILRGGNIDEFDWVTTNHPSLMPYIVRYVELNDECSFMEAFRSVDSVIYGEWRDRNKA